MKVPGQTSPRVLLAGIIFAAEIAACVPASQEGSSCKRGLSTGGINDPHATEVCEGILTRGKYTSPNAAARDVIEELIQDGTVKSLTAERTVILRHQFDVDALPLGLHKEGW